MFFDFSSNLFLPASHKIIGNFSNPVQLCRRFSSAWESPHRLGSQSISSQLYPADASPAILIYGAATTIGVFAISLLRRSRTPSGLPYRIYGTASPKNHSYLLSLGLDAVVDYSSPSWPAEILKLSGGISSALSTTGNISQTFVPQGGVIAVIRGAAWDPSIVREGVKPAYG